MKKVLGISAAIILIIAVGIIAVLGLSRKVPLSKLPKDVPIVNGKIISVKPFRSDDFTRGIGVEIETNLSLKDVAEFYSTEFSKRDFRVLGQPAFAGNAANLENATEADGLAETKSSQQVVVYIKSQPNFTFVRIQVKGNSILYLPE